MCKVAIAGIGVVGKALLEIIENEKQEFRNLTGEEIEVCGYLARSDKKIEIPFYQDYKRLIDETKPNILIELVGGADGVAYDMVKYAIENNISVITANKALIATKGDELFSLARDNKVGIEYEAAVAGAVPVIRLLKDVFNFEEITEVKAILNGTCNFILSKMSNEGCDYEDALLEAQNKGFAEADPTLDIDGTDTMQKLKIISALVAASKISQEEIFYEGITKLCAADIKYAKRNDLVIKLLAYGNYVGGNSKLHVAPVLLEKSSLLASTDDNYNAVNLTSRYAKDTSLVGFGAGGSETASSVFADLQNVILQKNSYEENTESKPYSEWIFSDCRYYFRYGNDVKALEYLLSNASVSVLQSDEEGKFLVAEVKNEDVIKDVRTAFPNLVYLAIID